jgi:hypothetical protein
MVITPLSSAAALIFAPHLKISGEKKGNSSKCAQQEKREREAKNFMAPKTPR